MANYGQLSTNTNSTYNSSSRYETPSSSRKCCGFSSRFIEYVLFIFNFIFFMSGVLILCITLLYGTPMIDLGETRLNDIRGVIELTHVSNLIHYSMVTCGIAICFISMVNACLSCCRKRESKPNIEDEHMELHLNDMSLNSHSSNTRNGFNHSSSPSSPPQNRKRAQYDDQKPGKSSLSLCFFIFCLLFLFTLQLVIGLVSFISVTPSHENEHKDEFLSSLTSENLNVEQTLTSKEARFEHISQSFKCCGWNGFEDYEITNKSQPVPDFCCKTIIPFCGLRKHPSNIFYDGCVEKFAPVLKEYIIILGSVALGFSIIEIFGLMFSCCLYVQIASNKKMTR